jgi:ElaB/YqjD/DUF883 family membrane-anchored ribosome-binding protein
MVKRSDDIGIEEYTSSPGETGMEVRNTSGVSEFGDEASTESLDANGADRTEEIRTKIEETRADMGETIDAIQERLSFANISEQVSEHVSNALETAKETVDDATIGKVVHLMKNTGNGISHSPVVKTVKDNPLPFILIGAGAGLLAYQGFSGKRLHSGPGYQRRQFRTGQQVGDIAGTSTQGAVGAARDKVSNAADAAYESVTRVAENTYTEAGELANRAREKAVDLGHKAQETYEHVLEERPWAIGIAALAAGAAVGMAIPASRYENELMGEARLNLMTKVQETADGFVDRAKQAATEAGRNISKEAKSLAEDAIG